MKVFIINGYYPHSYKGEHLHGMARGRLAQTLVDIMEDELSKENEVTITHIQDGYKISEEQEKLKESDLVIFHTPVYWFNVPSKFKQYFDDVYVPGILTGKNKEQEYGKSGILTGKYMLSFTWNAALSAFEKDGFIGQSVDDIMMYLHKMNQFIGLSKVETFSVHNVIKEPDIKKYEKDLRAHLQKVIKDV